VLSSIELRDIALPYLNELSRSTDQNVNLGVMDKTEVVYIERIKRRQMLTIELYVGSRVNMYRTSIGRAILAFLGHDKFLATLQEILKDPEAARYVGTEGKRLIALLEEVRRRGYALTDNDFMPGVRTVAAPIFNTKGDVEGAINMPVFGHAVSREELIGRYLPSLLQTAEKISVARGYAKPQAGSPGKDRVIRAARRTEKLKT
jgi:IclR family pca regulon transcriptional regulator